MNSSTKPTLVYGLGQQGYYFAHKLRDFGVGIHGTDIDPNKREAFQKEFPDALLYNPNEAGILPPPGMPTIIATNTPDHARAIRERIGTGTKNILSEKPLGFNLEQTQEIVKIANQNNVDIYTALLIRFSPAVSQLRGFMEEHDLIMVAGSVEWGKNRRGNNRPTAGDLEDEAVHGMDILLLMASLNQGIESMTVKGTLEFDDYVNKAVQQKMHNIDNSYPLNPNSRTQAITTIQTTHKNIQTILHSSFVLPEERRNVVIELAHKDSPDKRLYSARMDFDKRLPEGGVKDLLHISSIQNSEQTIEKNEFPTDKLGDQTRAWLEAVHARKIDPRLANLDDALRVAKWTDAVIRSNDSGGKGVRV